MSGYLARQVGLPQNQVDRLRFGLEIIIGSLIKGILLFVLAWVLNIVAEVVVALLVGSAFRLLAGGAHATSYMRCLILGLTLYLVTGWVSMNYASSLSPSLFTYLMLAAFLFTLFAVLLWAPGPVPGKKFTPSKHHRFKVMSVLYLFLLLGTMIILVNQDHLSLVLASILALLLQVFSLSPMGYRFIGRYDLLLSGVRRKEVAENVGQA